MIKPEGCHPCSLFKSGRGFVPDALPSPTAGRPRILFIGETPAKQELAWGQPFAGAAGFVLKEWGIKRVPALSLAWSNGHIGLGNMLRCWPPFVRDRAYPTGETKRQAESYCRQYDSFDGIDIIVLLGEKPQRYWFARELEDEDLLDRRAGRELKGVLGRAGRVYQRESMTGLIHWVFVPHPAAVLRQPALAETFRAALEVVADIAQGRSVASSEEQLDAVLGKIDKVCGVDYEFTPEEITVTGWSSPSSTRADPGFCELLFMLGETVAIHNGIAADFEAARKFGHDIPWKGQVFDTLLGAHALRPHLAGTGLYDLRSTVLLERRMGGETFPLDWKDYEGDIYATCRQDARAARWLAVQQTAQLDRLKLWPTYQTSHKAAEIFSLMAERGVRLDLDALAKIREARKTEERDKVSKWGLTETRGKKVKREVPIWRSPKILAKFQEVTGVDLAKKLGPRARGTRKMWEGLAKAAWLSDEGRQFARDLVSLSEGANDAHWLGQAEEAEDGTSFEKVSAAGYVYPRYNVAGSPDRPIAKGPNIQNFPRPSEDPRPVKLRSAVIPYEPNHVLLSVDYTAIESYTTAIEAGDWDRVQAIGAGDWHAQTAYVFDVSRQQGKSINHAFDKGESPHALASRLYGTTMRRYVERCRQIYARELEVYPRSRRFRANLWERSVENPLVVTNRFGRRMPCFSRSRYGEQRDWSGKHDPKLAYWCPCKSCAPRRERWKYALAFLGRSSAVDILLRTMIRIWKDKVLVRYSLPILENHDELVFSVPQWELVTRAAEATCAFTRPVPELDGFAPPAAAKAGPNWADLTEIKI